MNRPGSIISLPSRFVDFGPYHIGQAYPLAAKVQKGQRQAALTLITRVIDDDEMAGAVVTGPGKGYEAVRGPVAGPSRLRLDL
jgi:hypothetical protein